MRRIALLAAIVPAGILVAACLYLLAVIVLAVIPSNADFRSARDGVDVFVRSNGVHAELIVPITAAGIDWRQRLPVADLGRIDEGRDDVAFGWGDRGFYLATPTWSDLRLSTAVRALTGLDSTVLHVEAVPKPRLDAATRHIRLTRAQYARLAAFIDASFRTDSHGARILVAGAHYGAHDAFYQAQGHYSLFATCNEWTRRALDAAGVRVPAWSPFDKALFYQLPPG